MSLFTYERHNRNRKNLQQFKNKIENVCGTKRESRYENWR